MFSGGPVRRKIGSKIVVLLGPILENDIGEVDYFVGVKWFFKGWRLAVLGVSCIITGVDLVLSVFFKSVKVPMPYVHYTLNDWFTVTLASVLLIWAVTLKGRDIRSHGDHRAMVASYLKIREERLEEEFRYRNEMWVIEREEWKQQQMAELYEVILSQAERGVLKPRPEKYDNFD